MNHTPVFLDHLPDISSVTGEKPEQYRLSRNKALSNLLLESEADWQVRSCCPACGARAENSHSFSRAFVPFQRCTECNTIYAARVPSQTVLDRLRLEQQAATAPDHGDEMASEYSSVLNWVSLTEARLARRLDTVLDYRFCTMAPRFVTATETLSHSREWLFVPLEIEDDYGLLRDMLTRHAPKAVLIQAEMDRVRDPARLLQIVRENSPRGTLVFVATSCADGLEYEILGADSPSFIPLDRLNLFSIKGFESLARSTGFDILEVSTPGRRDAVLLKHFFNESRRTELPFWSSFFREADNDRLRDLQILLQRSLRSSIMRFVLEI